MVATTGSRGVISSFPLWHGAHSYDEVDPEVRCESFCEVCEAYNGKAAEDEAARCLRCNWPMLPVTVRRRHPAVTPPVEEPPAPEPGRFV